VKRVESDDLDLVVPPAELVDVGRLRVDGDNPNKMSVRRFEALKKSIKRYGFVVPIITNKDLLVADGEHRLKAAKELGMKQVSVVRLPVDDVDRRLLRQVMNKIRGEHDLFLDAEEYYRLVSEDSRDLLKQLVNETDLRIDNLLKLKEPFEYSNDEFHVLAEQFGSRVESNKLDEQGKNASSGEPLTLTCHVEFSTKAEVTKRTLAVCEAFGLGVDEARHFVVFDDFHLSFNRGDLICLTGDSGGGKSLLLDAFKNYFGEESICLDEMVVDPEETLVEGVGKDVTEAVKILSFCGLNDAFLFLRKYRELSEGQKYRYRLAKLIDRTDKGVWIVDEFCATLDRVMSRIVAFLLQKVARRLGKTVVVASTHSDFLDDFQPDILVKKGYERDVEVTEFSSRLERCSIYDHVHIEVGSIEDYYRLSRFHYKSKGHEESEGLRARDCFRLLFDGELVGVIVYCSSYLNLKPRNMVFGRRYVFTPGDLHTANLINEEIARISRVVIHPKFRGIGLGAFFVKETLPRVNAKVVEALAVMARYNPFFEKAGMIRVDYTVDRRSNEKEVRRFLESHNFDFDFVKSNTYCNKFFAELSSPDKQKLIVFLTDFARQPFIKATQVSPELLTKMFSSEATYLYWVNSSLVASNSS
jgi:ABC-type lipoprotein export system ATPase subunit/N-acetylglutamate synthase-like GNAT family acetyltransferase